MTVAQPMLTPAQYHSNRQLFSDHYLDSILPGRADWQMLVPAAAAARSRIAAILAAYQPSTSEAQTEHELVRPILEVLGHTFEVQAPLKTPDGRPVVEAELEAIEGDTPVLYDLRRRRGRSWSWPTSAWPSIWPVDAQGCHDGRQEDQFRSLSGA